MTTGPTTLARAQTSRGEIAIRKRPAASRVTEPVYELIVGGIFAMDTVDVSTEILLATEALARSERPRRVLIGGLGLGHTALAVLTDPRVDVVEVVEIEPDLIAWARAGLVPSLAQLVGQRRARLTVGDIASVLQEAGDRFDVILLDVDNGPSFLVYPGNLELYSPAILLAATERLNPGGVLAIWAAQPEPELLARLTALATSSMASGPRPPTLSVSERLVGVWREGRHLEYAIYFVERRCSGRPTDAS